MGCMMLLVSHGLVRSLNAFGSTTNSIWSMYTCEWHSMHQLPTIFIANAFGDLMLTRKERCSTLKYVKLPEPIVNCVWIVKPKSRVKAQLHYDVRNVSCCRMPLSKHVIIQIAHKLPCCVILLIGTDPNLGFWQQANWISCPEANNCHT